MWVGPHQTNMGKREMRQMLTAISRLCGQLSTGPSDVLDQSNARMRSPISPPPARQSNPVTLNGSSSFTIVEGIVYAPAAQIKLNGTGGTLILDQVIADTYDINGNGGTIKVLRGKGVDAVIVAAGLVD